MAQVQEQHGVSEEVIYDSQEEEDQWPESQSSVQDALAVTDTSRRRPQLLKVYGRSKVHCDLAVLNNRTSTDRTELALCSNSSRAAETWISR